MRLVQMLAPENHKEENTNTWYKISNFGRIFDSNQITDILQKVLSNVAELKCLIVEGVWRIFLLVRLINPQLLG